MRKSVESSPPCVSGPRLRNVRNCNSRVAALGPAQSFGSSDPRSLCSRGRRYPTRSIGDNQCQVASDSQLAVVSSGQEPAMAAGAVRRSSSLAIRQDSAPETAISTCCNLSCTSVASSRKARGHALRPRSRARAAVRCRPPRGRRCATAGAPTGSAAQPLPPHASPAATAHSPRACRRLHGSGSPHAAALLLPGHVGCRAGAACSGGRRRGRGADARQRRWRRGRGSRAPRRRRPRRAAVL